MGTNISRQTNEAFTKVTNDILTKVISNNVNTAKTNAKSYQSIVINAAHSRLNCDIYASQDSNIAAQALVNSSSEISSQMDSQMQTAIKNALENTLNQLNKGINIPPQTNIGDLTNKIMNQVTNQVQNIIQTSITNSVSVSAENNQNIVLNLQYAVVNCPGGRIDLSQRGIINTVAQTISKNITDAITKTAIANSITNEAENAVKQTNSGIDLFGLIGCIAVILVVLVLAGMMVTTTGRDLLTQNKYIMAGCIVVILILSSASSVFAYKKYEISKYE
jgi:hypothetical protein